MGKGHDGVAMIFDREVPLTYLRVTIWYELPPR